MNTKVSTPDCELVKSYINGNELPLQILIKRHQARIFGFIYSKTENRDVADDIFQDTFIKVIKTLKSNTYNEEGKFLQWVMRIAHNLVIDYFRHSKKMPLKRDTEEISIFEKITDESPIIENFLIKNEVEVDLKKLILELSNEQQEIIYLRMYQDLSFKEIAELKEISINTALGRMRYALQNLKKIIDKKNIILST